MTSESAYCANVVLRIMSDLSKRLQQKFYFICMERSAYHKNALKKTKCQYLDHLPSASETVPDGFCGSSLTRDSSYQFAERNLSCHYACDMNEALLQWI